MIPKSLKPRFFDALSNVTGRYVKPAPYHRARGLVRQVYEQIADEFFINGPITTHAVHPELLAAVWMAEREILLADQRLTREAKEALAVTISQVNGCSYCEDLINSVVYGAEQHDLAELMRDRRQDEIPDVRTRQLHSWARGIYDPESDILCTPPFSAEEAPEVIGTAMMLNYFTRYVQVFFSGTPLVAPFASRSLKTVLYRLTGIELHDSVIRRLEPGRAVGLPRTADLPPDLAWAAGNPTISAALSRWASVIDAAARSAVPTAVRTRLREELGTWRGEPMGLSRAWLEPKVRNLGAADAAAARLALLTALSPAQMSDDIVATYRQHFAGDAGLIVTVAWAAFMASKRVTAWLAEAGGHLEHPTMALAV